MPLFSSGYVFGYIFAAFVNVSAAEGKLVLLVACIERAEAKEIWVFQKMNVQFLSSPVSIQVYLV